MVLTSLDGDAGLELALEVRPDLLVIGDTVTTGGGRLLSESLRLYPELAASRLITITQRAPGSDTRTATQASGVATLELPFRPSAICAHLRSGG